MGAFICCAGRDRALVEPLLKALRRARHTVWIDEELTGGEAWWRTILDEIRACEVFIVALSKNMLESKACQAELRYAQDLGKPILPVQIGPLDNMRINPLAHMQVIDYRNPTIDTGIELVSSVHTRRSTANPLPDPLPEEPPIPFAYLMRLASTISSPTLTAQQQTTLVAELKAGLEEDGDDISARNDITQLLCMLRDRPDVTWRTRTDVEAILTSLQQPQHTPTPQQQPPPPPPPPQHQPPQQYWQPPTGPTSFTGPHPQTTTPPPPKKSRTRWLIAGTATGAVIAIALAAIIIDNVTDDPPTPPPPAATASDLEKALLSANEMGEILGRSDLVPTDVVDHMDETALTVSNPNCAGVVGTAIEVVYAGSGHTAVRDQAFTLEQPRYFVAQAAVLFRSQDQARNFVASLADKWNRCAGQPFSISAPGGEERWTVNEPERGESKVSQRATGEGAGGYACQHALTARSNVVVEALSCHDNVADEADRIVDKMTDKLPS
ncbi:sensor domain-containing protein [Mycolicibacterium sp. BiH015]|uniref:sensor domain-containing protein n=1 Tax=Mycolicibacterium sp. BiH015 TaxID=3018808 RepID=UPI0022E32B7C|nr:sensor domain-containing protein [Mycolicibacterium sp. BiH015]MDA2891257.1 sensor domain-containing protein [Mycolicibacterium sp. BiH015]